MIRLEKLENFRKVPEEHKEIIESLFNLSFYETENLKKILNNISCDLGKLYKLNSGLNRSKSACVFCGKSELRLDDFNSLDNLRIPVFYQRDVARGELYEIGNVFYLRD